jgi:multiple antibiotic resistance protein
MDHAAIITFATAMFTILNPVGGVAIFTGMVADRSKADRRLIAIKCSMAVAVILVGSVWMGEYVLKLFGLNIPSLQTAGGLIIAAISLSMLSSKQSPIHDTGNSDVAPGPGPDQGIAVVPLAMPVIAGPGAIATILVTTHQHQGIEANVIMSLICAGLAGAVCICFLGSDLVERALGENGMRVLTKFMGMILLAIAISMFASGAKGLLPGLAG